MLKTQAVAFEALDLARDGLAGYAFPPSMSERFALCDGVFELRLVVVFLPDGERRVRNAEVGGDFVLAGVGFHKLDDASRHPIFVFSRRPANFGPSVISSLIAAPSTGAVGQPYQNDTAEIGITAFPGWKGLPGELGAPRLADPGQVVGPDLLAHGGVINLGSAAAGLAGIADFRVVYSVQGSPHSWQRTTLKSLPAL